MVKWKFKTFLAVYSIAFIILIIMAGKYVWTALTEYQTDYETEKYYGNPDNIVMEYMQDFTAENIYEMIDEADYAYTIYEDAGVLKKLYGEIMDRHGDMVYSVHESESTDKIKRYYIFAGEDNNDTGLAYIDLERKNGLSKFGFAEWNVVDTTLIERFKAETEIIIRVPSYANVTVNGVPVSQDNIYTGEMAGIDESFAAVLGRYAGSDIEYNNYKFTDLYVMPDISVTDKDGKEIPYRYTADKVMEYDNFASREFVDEMLPTIQRIETAYGNYIIQYRDFSELRGYLIQGSELYDWITGSEIRWNTPPNSVLYDRWEISNAIIHNENCFTCDVYFYQNSDYGYNVLKEYENSFKSVFVRINGEWKLAYQKNK